MRTTRDEQIRAEQASAAVDQLLRDPEARPGRLADGDAGLLDTAQRLARLPALLGPVDPVLERRVMRHVQAAAPPQPAPRLRWGWAVAGLAAVLLVVALLTPMGQTAVASFMAVFNLGRTEVNITPVEAPALPAGIVAAGSTAVAQTLTLAEAQAQVSFTIPQPAYLPPDYRLDMVQTTTYPDLPAWIPQPFLIELVFGDDQGHDCTLRVYPITLGERASISGLNLEASSIQDVRDVEIGGRAGVLLQLGAPGAKAVWQEVVWEQDDLVLALSTADLPEDELLRMARSVR